MASVFFMSILQRLFFESWAILGHYAAWIWRAPAFALYPPTQSVRSPRVLQQKWQKKKALKWKAR